ncbi:MAG: MBL fold metallo-hydrolase [Xanthomonadales bacterium]|nr:MBL fold metallo-hydrolase [Xanthomonadales bacterium]
MQALVRSFHHADTGTWTHVLVDTATLRAAIIDPVLDFDAASGRVRADSARRVLEYIGTTGLEVEWILETHAHADHLTAAAWLRATLSPRPRIGIGAGIGVVQRHFAEKLGLGADALDAADFDARFGDGDTFEVGSLGVRVLATPGHTPDGVTYLAGDAAFIGDTLFAPRGGSARCDFPGASARTLFASIQRLYALPTTTRLFLAHDYPPAGEAPIAETTVAAQREANIHVRADTSADDYVRLREARDATLPVPKLLWPALQVNIRGGRLPDPSANGTRFLQVPLHDQR